MWEKLKEWFDTDEAADTLGFNEEIPADIFVRIIKQAATYNKEGTLSMWTDGNELLVSEEKQADLILNGLERATGEHCWGSGHYDPKEDINENCVDRYTGWWYVDIV